MTPGTVTPRTVRVAGAVAALQGGCAVAMAILLIVREAAGHHEDAISGYGTAGWFAIMGSGVLASGWALCTGRRWGRGIAVFANLVLLGVAWYVLRSGQLAYALAAAAVSVAVLALLFSPSGLRWLTQPEASSESSAPEIR